MFNFRLEGMLNRWGAFSCKAACRHNYMEWIVFSMQWALWPLKSNRITLLRLHTVYSYSISCIILKAPEIHWFASGKGSNKVSSTQKKITGEAEKHFFLRLFIHVHFKLLWTRIDQFEPWNFCSGAEPGLNRKICRSLNPSKPKNISLRNPDIEAKKQNEFLWNRRQTLKRHPCKAATFGTWGPDSEIW